MENKIENIKLKPCPFCGSALASVRYHALGCHHIECDVCHNQTSKYGGCQSADVWNYQPEIDRLEKEKAELREVLKEVKFIALQELEWRLEDSECGMCEVDEAKDRMSYKIDNLIAKPNKEGKYYETARTRH